MTTKINCWKKIPGELSFDDNRFPCDNASMSLILDKGGYLFCPKWCAAMSQSSKFCKAYQYELCNFPSREELYNNVPSCHPDTKPTVTLGKVNNTRILVVLKQ